MRRLAFALLVAAACGHGVHLDVGDGGDSDDAGGSGSGSAVCGDGVRTGVERCDGADLGSASCASLGLGVGEVACFGSGANACTFDTSGCTLCDDGTIEPSESCDGTDVGSATCATADPHLPEGQLACSHCAFDTSGCGRCSDGVAEGDEVCDHADLRGQTCAGLGSDFDSGVPTCNATCDGFDSSACGKCGDGVRAGPEQCDTAGSSCNQAGHQTGSGSAAPCKPDCTFDTSACGPACVAVEDATMCDGVDNNCNGSVDESCVVPTAPVARFPWDGYTTGSVHAAASLTPTFRWEPSSGPAFHYELKLSTVCTGAFPSCTVGGSAIVVASTQTSFKTPTLAVSTLAPVGARYFWQIRACNGPVRCSAFTAPRYVDVGRLPDDINGDGFSDLVVGQYKPGGNTGSIQGNAYVYLGSAGGLGSAVTQTLTSGGGGADQYGLSVAMGDIDGDGFADVAIGAPALGTGRAFVYRGSKSGVVTASSEQISSPGTASAFGFALSIGDVDADGTRDLAVGDIGGGSGGDAFVFLGASLFTLPHAHLGPFTTSHGTGATHFGAWVLVTVDFDGDGVVDLAASAPNVANGGEVDVFGGVPSSGPDPLTPQTLTRPAGTPPACEELYYLAGGDVNGDGFADLAAGCGFDEEHPGAVEIYLGARSGLGAPSEVVNPQCVGSVTTCGGDWFHAAALADFDGDGSADLVVGASRNSFGSVTGGEVFVFRPDLETVDSQLGEPSPATGAQFGQVVSAGHDFDGNGRPDMCVSAVHEGGSTAGAVFVYLRASASSFGSPLKLQAPTTPPSGDSDGFGEGLP